MEKLIKIFKALSDKNRLRIVKMLQQKQLCVCEITAILGLATSTVSKHLSILKEVEIISDTKSGKWVDYHLNRNGKNIYWISLLPLISYWLDNDEQIRLDMKELNNVSRDEICKL